MSYLAYQPGCRIEDNERNLPLGQVNYISSMIPDPSQVSPFFGNLQFLVWQRPEYRAAITFISPLV